MHPLLQQQGLLHSEANMLIQDILIPLLSNYGEVKVGGSYSYKLLNYPDLDIDVVTEDISKDKFAELCKKFISLPSVSKFQAADRVNFPHEHPGNRPTGFWLSPKMKFEENIWSIDIWLQKPDWYTGNTNMYMKELLALPEEKRILILTLKDQLRSQKIYGVGKGFESIDIYEAVLHNNVNSFDELLAYKNNKPI